MGCTINTSLISRSSVNGFSNRRQKRGPIVLYHQHQDYYHQYIRVPESDKRREHSRSRSPPHKRHRSDTRGKQRHSPPSRRDTVAPDGSADTRLSTSTTRPQNVLCYRCGKKHGPGCKLSIHPDANTNPAIKWTDTRTGRAMALANAGHSLDLLEPL